MTMLRSLALTCALLAAAPAAASGCYADYKAKRDSPLQLHYGVVALRGDCTLAAARREIPRRIARDGWVLLTVISVFGEDQLAKKERDAGPFYLRY